MLLFKNNITVGNIVAFEMKQGTLLLQNGGVTIGAIETISSF